MSKVLVAMSGGVDSSVTLLKIIEMGHQPIGITMKLWEYKFVGGNNLQDNNCCAIESINNAKLVCERLGVPHYTIDFTEDFREKVVENFVSEYTSGRTPNPCVRCNSYVKWDTFIKQADKLGAEYIATGHYAIINKKNEVYSIKRGKDAVKDQAYVLWGIPKNTLSRTILPLGELTKKEVRNIARENSLETADTPESMEICFVADNNYSRFIKEYTNRQDENEGTTLDESNNIVGKNPGYINYTIGQRKGIGVTNPDPLYVKKINAKENTITVSKKDGLLSDCCKISNINWLIEAPSLPIKVNCQIRYNGNVSKALIDSNNDTITANFETPQLAITPGQSIVFFDNEDTLLGGGVIEIYD